MTQWKPKKKLNIGSPAALVRNSIIQVGIVARAAAGVWMVSQLARKKTGAMRCMCWLTEACAYKFVPRADALEEFFEGVVLVSSVIVVACLCHARVVDVRHVVDEGLEVCEVLELFLYLAGGRFARCVSCGERTTPNLAHAQVIPELVPDLYALFSANGAAFKHAKALAVRSALLEPFLIRPAGQFSLLDQG